MLLYIRRLCILLHSIVNKVSELCCYYVALLRSIYLIHYNSHWLTRGTNFYGNHLLHERIAKTAAEDTDLAAEKFIGLFGNSVIDLDMQASLIGKFLKEFASQEPLQSSLGIEKKFLEFSEKIFKTIKEENELTLGLEDTLQTIASNREAAVYLLQQAMDEKETKEANMDYKMRSRMKLLTKLSQAQSGAVGTTDNAGITYGPTEQGGGRQIPIPATNTIIKAPAPQKSDPFILALQKYFLSKGYKLPRSGVDGKFGPETKSVLRQWQEQQALPRAGEPAGDPLIEPTGELDGPTTSALRPLIAPFFKR